MSEMFVDVEKGLEVLSSLPPKGSRKCRCSSESTLVKLVQDGLDKIEDLGRNGYTQEEICEILRQRLGIKFPTTTFRTYITRARKMREMAEQEAEAR